MATGQGQTTRLDFGHTLSDVAQAPIYRAFEHLREVRVIPGLTEVSKDKLLEALNRGVAVTAKRLGLKPREVEAILPWAEMMNQVERLECARVVALSTFEAYAAAVGGLLTGLAGATIEVDPKRRSAAQTLMNVARRFSRERTLVDPLKALSAELDHWEEAMEKAGELIDKSKLVRRHVQKRQLFRVALGFLIFAVLSVVGAVIVREKRITTARQKLDARIAAATDVCAVADVSEDEKRYALPDHYARIDAKKKACEEIRAKEKYELSCDALAKGLEAGNLSDDGKAAAKDMAAKLERAASAKLGADDLLATPAEMPCKDTKAKDRIWLAYVRGVARSTDVWADGPKLSDDLTKALASKDFANETAYKTAMVPDAEDVAKKAIQTGDPQVMERATHHCRYRSSYGLELGKQCTRFLSIVEGLEKQKKK